MSTKYIGLLSGLLIFMVLYLLPAPEGLSSDAKNAAGVALLMAIWWITEALPIYATSFVPIAFFPLFGILSADETAKNYGHDLILMLYAGFFLARAIELHNLHKRIAHNIINIFGTSRKKILASMMIATAFLSMWIANVTAVVLMLPIALAIITQDEEDTGAKSKFGVALLLGLAYSASVGGTATLIGSPTNLIFSGMMQKMFPLAPQITFFEWFKIGFPLLILFLPLVWFYLVVFFGVKGSLSDPQFLHAPNGKTAKMSPAERRVLLVFLFAALGWIFRDSIVIGSLTIPGWSKLLGLDALAKDSTVGILSSLLLFSLPAANLTNKQRLLDWKSASQIPWGVGVIVGGGYAMAESFKTTGLASWLGDQLAFINNFPPLIVIAIVVGFILLFTELNPNTATVNIFLPILASMAVAAQINPLFLMLPATIASSFVFMMPAGTGPNTVVFGSNKVSIRDMVRCGAGLKVISLFILTFFLYFFVNQLSSGHSLPDWVR